MKPNTTLLRYYGVVAIYLGIGGWLVNFAPYGETSRVVGVVSMGFGLINLGRAFEYSSSRRKPDSQ